MIPRAVLVRQDSEKPLSPHHALQVSCTHLAIRVPTYPGKMRTAQSFGTREITVIYKRCMDGVQYTEFHPRAYRTIRPTEPHEPSKKPPQARLGDICLMSGRCRRIVLSSLSIYPTLQPTSYTWANDLCCVVKQGSSCV